MGMGLVPNMKTPPVTVSVILLMAIGARRPDLVTLDIQLPGLWGGGTMVYRKMRLPHSGLRDIPVIVITGLTTGDRDAATVIHSFLEAGQLPVPDAYLDKPLAADHLTEVVQKVLAREV